MKSRKNYKLRAIIQIMLIFIAVLIIYIANGLPYFSYEHELNSVLKRNLAQNAEIIYSDMPDDSEWSEAEERIYIVKYNDEIGAFRTMKTQIGNTAYMTQHDFISRINMYDGLGIAPLYPYKNAEDRYSQYKYEKGVCALISIRDDIKSVELRHFDGQKLRKSINSTEERNGIYILELDIIPEILNTSFVNEFDIYNDMPRNYFGAVGYDKNENQLVRIKSHCEKE